jgi:hypothetical protein
MASTMLKDSTLESLTPSVNMLLLHKQNFAWFFKYFNLVVNLPLLPKDVQLKSFWNGQIWNDAT